MNTEPSLHVTGNEAVKRLHLFLLIAVFFLPEERICDDSMKNQSMFFYLNSHNSLFCGMFWSIAVLFLKGMAINYLHRYLKKK